MKIIKYGSQPLSDKEFSCIKHLAEQNNFNQPLTLGLLIDKSDARVNYINKVISFIDLKAEASEGVINSGNGAAGQRLMH